MQAATYTEALLRDLDFELATLQAQGAEIQQRSLTSIFFGGGTPSLFPAEDIQQILAGAAERLNFARDIEITMEANPGASEQARFIGYRQAGVNRLSIGMQSFSDHHLTALGRIHSAADAKTAYQQARDAGFDNVNVDIMYALPKQSLEEAIADCETAINLEPEHISHYQLTLEPGTAFAHRPPPLPDHDLAWDMQETCQALLAQEGYQQYEVSAYARAERRCQHNLAYWQYADYLGIGAGAHGKISWQHDGKKIIQRRARRPHPSNYMQTAGTADTVDTSLNIQDANQRVAEFMLNALRLNDGFTLQQFEQATDCSAAILKARVKQAIDRDLLSAETYAEKRIQPTAFGRQHLNSLLIMFDE